MKKNLIILFLIYSCSNSKSNSTIENYRIKPLDTLKFSYHGFNNGAKLNLISNGFFINEDYVYGCVGGGFRKKVFGKYQIKNNQLTLLPEKIKYTEFPLDFESKPKTSNVSYGPDSLKIKTKFQIVKWGDNEYLLSDYFHFGWGIGKENDYLRFADYLNDGSEPKSSGMYLVNKTNDPITTEFDLKQIPKKWQKHFLKEPISAKIKSIEKIIDSNDDDYIYWKIELDKGEKDRMNKRLTLVTKNEEFFIEVDSVLINTSYGTTNMYDFSPKKFPIGTELRTKWK
ncbi:hypothetical protein [uncultured Tenacibaculum sp.]|uniref:hypothetical protein n=1 Tax=uncultured Tenacibaculum sp. TaxID=174713 RepID=UPI00260990A5|nr:hypothetical protein [uncultured Tenacibaculum sp.]